MELVHTIHWCHVADRDLRRQPLGLGRELSVGALLVVQQRLHDQRAHGLRVQRWRGLCDVSWSTDDAQVIMVTDFDPLNYAVQAWGEASYTSGGVVYSELFCCPLAPKVSMPTVTSVEITGSDYADELRFTWTYGSTYSQYEATNDYIWAGLRGDLLVGSMSGNTSDHLYGEEHPDTINALNGNDFCYGGEGPDTMSGGPGNDYMQGDDESDTMTGNEGNDTMLGGKDRDFMNGLAGDDDMDGGAGGDVMCGGSEDPAGLTDDLLTDGDSVSELVGGDILWGAQTGDDVDCNATNTQWDGVSTTGSCSGNPVHVPPGGATMPVDCP